MQEEKKYLYVELLITWVLLPSYTAAMIWQYDKTYRAPSLKGTIHITFDQKASVRPYICLHSNCEARCTYLAAICNLTANSHHTLVFEQCSSMESSSLGNKTYVIFTNVSQGSRMYWDLHQCLQTQCKHIGHARKLGTLWNHQQCPHSSIGWKSSKERKHVKIFLHFEKILKNISVTDHLTWNDEMNTYWFIIMNQILLW